MLVLGDVKFNWDASCREAESIRWEANGSRNFKANRNTDKGSQAALIWDWLGSIAERVL